jgi:MORN repeat
MFIILKLYFISIQDIGGMENVMGLACIYFEKMIVKIHFIDFHIYTITMEDGKYEKYEGDWVADRKQGRGVFTSIGGKYEGTFRDDR